MALPTDPTYITYDEFRANTRVQAQKTMTDDELKPYILHSERVIDSYIGYVVPSSEGQNKKFPIKDRDGNSSYPNNLKLACIEIAMQLILKGETELSELDEADTQEWTANGYKIKYRNMKTNQTINLDLPPFAVRLLRQWGGQTCALTFGF